MYSGNYECPSCKGLKWVDHPDIEIWCTICRDCGATGYLTWLDAIMKGIDLQNAKPFILEEEDQ